MRVPIDKIASKIIFLILFDFVCLTQKTLLINNGFILYPTYKVLNNYYYV